MRSAALSLLTAASLLSGCAGSSAMSSDGAVSHGEAPEALRPTMADAFFLRVQALCGRSFTGRVVTTDPADADFAGKVLVMQVAQCSPHEIRIPFTVGEDRSRTWVITRTAAGLRLKHDHRHPDGTPDAVTMYGGDSLPPGSATRQEFPVDAESIALFNANNAAVSITNVWAVEVHPGRSYVYELTRPNRRLRVEFDTTKPLAD